MLKELTSILSPNAPRSAGLSSLSGISVLPKFDIGFVKTVVQDLTPAALVGS